MIGMRSGRPPRRRFFVPEVVQTSTMDCGPAALKSLLDGYGRKISYEGLREACSTDVDGTSLDTIEDLAARMGLDAEQIMLPADYLLLPEAAVFPSILTVRLPNGATHFICPVVPPREPGTGHGSGDWSPLDDDPQSDG